MKKSPSRQDGSAAIEDKQLLIRMAQGETPAALVLKNASYVNVFSQEVLKGDIAIADGIIVGIDDYRGMTEIDMTGKTIVPGFIDSHIHLESSLLSPGEFARAVLSHGTTTVIADPHEIANVCGLAGLDYMLEATAGLPIDVYFMLPSCVPAAPVDENGASLTAEDIDRYYSHPRVRGLAEMMNYPGVITGDEDVLCKIVKAQQHDAVIDGHAPGLSGKPLAAYTCAGITSDHECASLEDALEKLRLGQHIMIREGTAAQTLEALIPLLPPQYAPRCMFATDDKHPLDLLEKGHIDYIARKAVSLGADPILTVSLTSWNAAQYFRLKNKGAVAPGYIADLAVLDDLQTFSVCAVFKNGRLVPTDTELTVPQISVELQQRVHHTFDLPEITVDRLHADHSLALIGMVPGQIFSRNLGFADRTDPEKDILKAAVAERHHHTGHIGLAYIRGYGLKRGAVATSVAHDSHNLIGIGANDADLALAMNRVTEIGGGMVVVDAGAVTAEIALPIAGLMSEAPIAEVNRTLESVKAHAYAQGAGRGIDPFMNLSFLSLPVIPELRLLTQGAFDVEAWEFVNPPAG